MCSSSISGERKNSVQMSHIAVYLTDKEIAAKVRQRFRDTELW